VKKIVLKGLTPLVTEMLEEKAAAENIDLSRAVIEILSDAAIERAVEHDMKIMKESLVDDEPNERVSHHCCCCCCRNGRREHA